MLIAFGLATYLRGDKHVNFLLLDFKRATLCPAFSFPDQVISMNCPAVYRLDDEPGLREHILAHPSDLRSAGGETSAASPLGIAMLLLRVRERMLFCENRSGEDHIFRV